MSRYVLINGETRGPFTTEAVATMVAEGMLSPNDLIWEEDQESWLPIESVVQVASNTQPIPADDTKTTANSSFRRQVIAISAIIGVVVLSYFAVKLFPEQRTQNSDSNAHSAVATSQPIAVTKTPLPPSKPHEVSGLTVHVEVYLTSASDGTALYVRDEPVYIFEAANIRKHISKRARYFGTSTEEDAAEFRREISVLSDLGGATFDSSVLTNRMMAMQLNFLQQQLQGYQKLGLDEGTIQNQVSQAKQAFLADILGVALFTSISETPTLTSRTNSRGEVTFLLPSSGDYYVVVAGKITELGKDRLGLWCYPFTASNGQNLSLGESASLASRITDDILPIFQQAANEIPPNQLAK